VSCDKTAELIEMQFGMLSLVGPGTCITWDVDASTGRALLRVFGQLKNTVKHRIFEDRKTWYNTGWLSCRWQPTSWPSDAPVTVNYASSDQ